MYLGRQPMSQEPYLCMFSDLDWYLSAGFTKGALNVPVWSRGAVRIFWASLGRATFWQLVVDKHREKASFRVEIGCLEALRAEAKALLLQILLVIAYHEGL